MANGPTRKEIALDNPKSRIETEVMLGDISWGKFEPAIRRWERVLGRPAPAPTKPDGKDGAHRLSSAFTEWMMGLPEGWVTSVGLKRNEELKACGNGVVPQQAAYALRILLGGNTNAFESLATLPTTRAQNGENRNNKIWARDLSKPQNLENALAITVPGLVDETATGGGASTNANGRGSTRRETLEERGGGELA